jgi:GTP-binding protein
MPADQATPTIPPQAIEAGRLLFAAECVFLKSVAELKQIPEPVFPEIAFAGRSNVGKSSLVNALANRKGLARTSNTPGRTQMINFFLLGGRLMLADLPGYGFARAPKTLVKTWTKLVKAYLKGRPTLARAIVLVDARHGVKDSDREIMSMLDEAAVSYLVVMTKADKLGDAEAEKQRAAVQKELAKRPAAYPHVILTSSVDNRGIPELRAHLAALAAPGFFN